MIITDENYISEMQKGNENALRYFIEQYGWIVKSIIHKMMAGYPAEQEDCMNDTFLAIWKNVGQYDKRRAAFTTWIAGVTRYQVLAHIRDIKGREYVDIDSLELVGDGDVISQIFNQDEKEEFLGLLEMLSEEDREIFLQLFWEERTYDEVSRRMAMPTDRVYSRVSRGKKKLRKMGKWIGGRI